MFRCRRILVATVIAVIGCGGSSTEVPPPTKVWDLTAHFDTLRVEVSCVSGPGPCYQFSKVDGTLSATFSAAGEGVPQTVMTSGPFCGTSACTWSDGALRGYALLGPGSQCYQRSDAPIVCLSGTRGAASWSGTLYWADRAGPHAETYTGTFTASARP